MNSVSKAAKHIPMMKIMRQRFDVVDSKLLIDVLSGKTQGIQLLKD